MIVKSVTIARGGSVDVRLPVTSGTRFVLRIRVGAGHDATVTLPQTGEVSFDFSFGATKPALMIRRFGWFVVGSVLAWGCGNSSSSDESGPGDAGQGSGGDAGGGAATGGSSRGGASGSGGQTGGRGGTPARGGSAGSETTGGSGGSATGGQAGDGAGGAGEDVCSEAKPIVISSEEDLEAFAARGCETLDGSLFVTSETLTSFDALGQPSVLRTITGTLSIVDCPALVQIEGIRGLETIGGSLLVRGNGLVNLGGLESLRRIGSDPANDAVVFTNNPTLTNVTALSGVTSVVASLSVSNNSELTSLEGLDGLVETSSVTIAGNALLAALDGLTELEQAMAITIASNAAIAEVSLPGLLGAGSLSITSNPALETVALPLLASAENLTIAGNAELTSVGTLSELTDVGLLVIAGNVKLPQCSVDALDARLMACDMSCGGNDTSATCN
ncbi:MAG TPA: hypothetical protein VFZ53_28105 [Polyangiaceae bacterium]